MLNHVVARAAEDTLAALPVFREGGHSHSDRLPGHPSRPTMCKSKYFSETCHPHAAGPLLPVLPALDPALSTPGPVRST